MNTFLTNDLDPGHKYLVRPLIYEYDRVWIRYREERPRGKEKGRFDEDGKEREKSIESVMQCQNGPSLFLPRPALEHIEHEKNMRDGWGLVTKDSEKQYAG